MNLPTIFDWLTWIAPLRGNNAAILVMITAVLVVMFGDWRLRLLALMAQYLVATILFVEVLDPRLAIAKLWIGLFVCLILYFTARQVNLGRLPDDVTEAEAGQVGQGQQVHLGPFTMLMATPFRLGLALLMVAVIAIIAPNPAYQLLAVPMELEFLNLAIYALVVLGLLGMSIGGDPMGVGVGLLTFFIGFELFYSVLEQSVVILAGLAGANLLIALVISYLVQRRHTVTTLTD